MSRRLSWWQATLLLGVTALGVAYLGGILRN